MVIIDHLRETAYAGLVGLAFHVGHAAFVPPYKREEHAPEQEPLRAGDIAYNVNFAASTSGAYTQTGSIW